MDADLGPEAWLVREVFASFGLAIYQSNCLEHGLATLLATAWNETPITQSQYDELHHDLRAKTFGVLIRRAQAARLADASLVERLGQCLEVRNRLAHRYFEEHAAAFMFPDGQERMRQELHKLADSFQVLHLELSEIVKSWREGRGIVDADFDLATRELTDAYLRDELETNLARRQREARGARVNHCGDGLTQGYEA
jgi:hypothetical protein